VDALPVPVQVWVAEIIVQNVGWQIDVRIVVVLKAGIFAVADGKAVVVCIGGPWMAMQEADVVCLLCVTNLL